MRKKKSSSPFPLFLTGAIIVLWVLATHPVLLIVLLLALVAIAVLRSKSRTETCDATVRKINGLSMAKSTSLPEGVFNWSEQMLMVNRC